MQTDTTPLALVPLVCMGLWLKLKVDRQSGYLGKPF
jgi:hypothetical protein